MELILSNHGSFPRIGDHADLQVLRKTIGQFEKGQKNQADLRAAEDRMTELALGEHPTLDEDAAEAAPDPLVFLEGVSQLVGRDEPTLEQDVTELLQRIPPVRGRRIILDRYPPVLDPTSCANSPAEPGNPGAVAHGVAGRG